MPRHWHSKRAGDERSTIASFWKDDAGQGASDEIFVETANEHEHEQNPREGGLGEPEGEHEHFPGGLGEREHEHEHRPGRARRTRTRTRS